MGRVPHKTSRRLPRVTVFVSMRSCYGPSVMRGIFAHIAEHGEWRLDIVRFEKDVSERIIYEACAHHANGFIVAVTDTFAPSNTLLASGIPFVTIENDALAREVRSPLVRHIRLDNHDIGRSGAREFIAEGRYSSFGFVPERSGTAAWSSERCRGFSDEFHRHNAVCITFSEPPAGGKAERIGNIAKWRKRLRKPAAIMAADDSIAMDVLQACSAARLRVPNDIAVLGVDDEEFICESTTPQLSSIRPNFTEAGRLAAETLERLMRNSLRNKGGASEITVRGESEIIRRASTSRETSSGQLVQRALAFIHHNAKRGIGVRDVVAHLRVSRSLADLRFREVRGESILSVITAARLGELKAKLARTDEPIGEVTRRLGWANENYPKNLFRKHFGITMNEYRRRNRA